MKPLNSGHTGGRTLVHCREVVPLSEILTGHTPNLELVYAEGCGRQEAESASLDQTRSAWAKIDKTLAREWTDYLSNKRQTFVCILIIYACSFGLRSLLEVINPRRMREGYGSHSVCLCVCVCVSVCRPVCYRTSSYIPCSYVESRVPLSFSWRF